MADPVLAPKVRDLFFDAQGNYIPSDYKVMHGGRGGLKSWGFARVAVMLASVRKLRIACAREYQASIEESVHQTLKGQIEALGLESYYQIHKRSITNHIGSEFFFAGIKTEPRKFKSTEDIDILFIEEGESTSETSWQIVEPTIRKPGSEIWCGFNPDLPTDPTSRRFLIEPVPNARIVETNWRDNLWLSERMVRLKDYLARVDPEAYQHVWEGKFRTNSAAQIFKGKYRIEDFTPGAWDGPYFGADWGFSQDPTTLVKCWVYGRCLYIEQEAWAIGRDTDTVPQLFDQIAGAKLHVIRGDNSRPETISYLQRHGYPRITAAEKWPGSVEDGIAFIRQFESVVIHTRCAHAIEEAKLYSFKTDRLTGDVLTDIVDKHNHIWDAVRYALAPLIRRSGFGFVDFATDEIAARKAKETP